MSLAKWIVGAVVFLKLLGDVACLEKVSARLPKEYVEDGRMASKLNCQPQEIRHFRYLSETQMWGAAGGTVTLAADLAVHCLGVDKGGYGPEALKYLVEISGITSTPSYNSTKATITAEQRSRQKRGIRDFFNNIWQRIKGFFNRVFGRESGSSTAPATTSKSDEEREKEDPSASEDYEVFDPEAYNRLYGTPFEFVQLANGSIPEIRFAENDTEQSVRNFKRHLTDLFTTHLDRAINSVEEVSPLGKHKTKYMHSGTRGGLQSASLVSVLLTSASSAAKDTTERVKVTRLFDSGDIVSFSQSTKGMNNPRELSLDARQVQEFDDGEMTSSEGNLHFSLNNLGSPARRRRHVNEDDDDELLNYFKVKTSFTLQLQKRHRRSTQETSYNELEKQLKFTPHSLAATVSSDVFITNRLETLRHKLLSKSDVLKTMIHEHDSETSSIALEIIQLESKLGLENDETSLINKTRKLISQKSVDSACLKNLTEKCQDILLLMTNVGGTLSEQIALTMLDEAMKKNFPNHVDMYLISSISTVPKPSSLFINSLVDRFSKSVATSNQAIAGPLAVSLATLVAPIPHVKTRVGQKITEALRKDHSCDQGDVSTSSRLFVRSLGVLRDHKSIVDVSRKCGRSVSLQEEVIQALKDSLGVEDVQRRLLELLEDSSSCHLKAQVVNMLENVAEKQDQRSDSKWPLNGFNQLDEVLTQNLLGQRSRCLEQSIVRYFQLKQDNRAEQALSSLTQRTGRQTRELPDSVVCDDWLNGNASQNNVLLDEGEDFNRWRWCSGQQYLGRQMANAQFSGGLFAGVQYPSNPPRYKVNAKFKANTNFLGRNFDISTASFNVDDNSSKAKVEVLGRTLLDLKGEKCSQDEFIYRPAEHIPIYALNIWIVEVSLGLHLGVDTILAFKCPQNGYQFLPKAKLRVGGEATGRILMLRGGINLGGNFNYHIRSQLTPYPSVCIDAKRGYDPMNIGIESWFEFWKPWFLSWGGRQTWNPKFLKWDISDSKEEKWVKPYCLLDDNTTAHTYS